MLELTKESNANGLIKFSFEIPKEDESRMETAVKALFNFIRSKQDKADDGYVSAEEALGPVVPARILHGFRIRDGLTQKQLAEAVGMKQHHISEIETGKREISKSAAHKFADFFKTSYKAFL